MLPSAMKAMKNPDGDKLQEVLPPELYARWSVLKQRYMGRDAGVEKKRPLIAAYELYREALSKNGLRESGVIDPVISEALKARKMKRTPALLEIAVDDPRAALADFRKEVAEAGGSGVFPQDPRSDRERSSAGRGARERMGGWRLDGVAFRGA